VFGIKLGMWIRPGLRFVTRSTIVWASRKERQVAGMAGIRDRDGIGLDTMKFGDPTRLAFVLSACTFSWEVRAGSLHLTI
jgi:hypothetical protein